MASQVSKEGLAAIKREEGCRLDAYQCSAGRWTIGYGDTHRVKPGDRITMEEADRRFAERISEFERGVGLALKRPTTQGQFDALVSLAYNIGVPALSSSQLMQLFNAGELVLAAREFARWVHRRGPLRQLREGMKGQEVADWQRTLKQEGIACQVDASFGPQTVAATKLYQDKLGPEHQLTPPGVGWCYEKVVDPVLVRRRFREVVRFLT